MTKKETFTRYEFRNKVTNDKFNTQCQSRKITITKEYKEHTALFGCIKWWTVINETTKIGKWKDTCYGPGFTGGYIF